MSGYRSIRETNRYRKKLQQISKNNSCDFCQIKLGDEQFIKETRHFKVIRNIYPYSLWDEQRVGEHLMIIPKIHTDRLSDLPESAYAEYAKLLVEYELLGFGVYVRAPGTPTKSVIHQHTHLIKVTGGRKHLLVHARQPYLRISL